jgi:hypothetical protein
MLTAFIFGSAAVLIDAAQEYVFEQKLVSLTQQMALATKSIASGAQSSAHRTLAATATALLAEFDGKSPSNAFVKSATMPDGQTIELTLCADYVAPMTITLAATKQLCEEALAR